MAGPVRRGGVDRRASRHRLAAGSRGRRAGVGRLPLDPARAGGAPGVGVVAGGGETGGRAAAAPGCSGAAAPRLRCRRGGSVHALLQLRRAEWRTFGSTRLRRCHLQAPPPELAGPPRRHMAGGTAFTRPAAAARRSHDAAPVAARDPALRCRSGRRIASGVGHRPDARTARVHVGRDRRAAGGGRPRSGGAAASRCGPAVHRQ